MELRRSPTEDWAYDLAVEAERKKRLAIDGLTEVIEKKRTDDEAQTEENEIMSEQTS